MNYSIREIGENIKKLQFFAGEMRYDEVMALHTTMKVGGTAALFVEPRDVQSAAGVLSVCAGQGVPVFLLGGGSNLVVSDDGFEGVVLSTSLLNTIALAPYTGPVEQQLPIPQELVQTGLKTAPVAVQCGCGARMDDIAEFCARYGLAGLDHFAGLPGTAGGAAYMNARCYEKNVSDVLVSAQYIDLDEAAEHAAVVKTYSLNRADWSYKRSPFQTGNVLVTQVTFLCTGLDARVLDGAGAADQRIQDSIRKLNDHYVQDRISKGHFKAPSAGSVFKNNHDFGKPSGVLIDQAELKGTAVGGAQIAPWHGNFIINTGSATAADIHALVTLVQRKVQAQSGCLLEPEIIFCGKGFTQD